MHAVQSAEVGSGALWPPKTPDSKLPWQLPPSRFIQPYGFIQGSTNIKKDMATQTDLGSCFDSRHAYLGGYRLLPIPTMSLPSPGLPSSFPRSIPYPGLKSPNSASSTSSKPVFDFNIKNINTDGFETSPLVSPTEPRRNGGNHMFCGFCFNNAKANGIDISSPGRWSQHNLRDQEGRVSCPCLRMFQCPICGASGDTAHTQRHCPKRNRQ